MPRLHHVNLAVVGDEIDDEIDWLIEVLGYERIPDERTNVYWFAAGDGTEVHLTKDPQHRVAEKAHTAVEYDDLTEVRQRLDRRTQPYEYLERETMSLILCQDPGGNRWELRTPERR